MGETDKKIHQEFNRPMADALRKSSGRRRWSHCTSNSRTPQPPPPLHPLDSEPSTPLVLIKNSKNIKDVLSLIVKGGECLY